MMRALKWAVAAVALVVAASAPLEASHIFATNGSINGTPLADLSGFTDPTIFTTVDAPITLHFDLFSTDGDSDSFSVSFGDLGGSTLSAPASDFFAYDGSGTLATPVSYDYVFSYGSTGVFNGFVVPDMSVSFPDYLMPDGSELSEPAIPFHIVVSAAAVPEPASLTLVGLGAFGLVAGAIRRRKQAAR